MWLHSQWISGRQWSEGLGQLLAPFSVSGPQMEYCLKICPQGITKIPLYCPSCHLTKLYISFSVSVCAPHKYHMNHSLYTHTTYHILQIYRSQHTRHFRHHARYTQILDISPTYTLTTLYTRHHTPDISHYNTCTEHTSHANFEWKDPLKAWNIRFL